MMAAGLRQLYTGSFVRLVPATPAWLTGTAGWARGAGLLLVLAGAAMLTRRWARPAALAVAALLLLVFVAAQLPPALGNPWTGYMWTNPCKVLALFGGALAIANFRRGPAWFLLAVFLMVCGVQHFVYAAFVDTLVPGWIPPGRRFWTITAGLALLAGGTGLLVPRTARAAALLSALMVFLWVFLVHLPRAASGRSSMEFDGVGEALAICGVALLAAGAPRGGRAPEPLAR
ncbi:MAG TPA: hypothetical protein VG936_07495 [Lacunisphaera sp.]|nr:hypothetical protein [Lacunisphaera sp.]